MSNTDCKLPKRSEVVNKKGYQEIHIPALAPYKLKAGEKLVKIEEMPTWAHKAFEGMKVLNTIQSRVYPVAFGKSDNMLVCAPTGLKVN